MIVDGVCWGGVGGCRLAGRLDGFNTSYYSDAEELTFSFSALRYVSHLTLKRPPGVKFDPSLSFFLVTCYVSFSDTKLRVFVTSVL